MKKSACLRILASTVLFVGQAASPEVGISAKEVLLGQPAAFSGPSAALGIEMWRGAQSAFSEVNDAGGINGRKIRLVIADDAYDPVKALPAVQKLVEVENVFALFGGVGTPTIAQVLPYVLQRFRSDGLFYFANFTGAQLQREPPYDVAVFNVRASYRQETRAIVEVLLAGGRQKVGVFFQDDAYGASVRSGVQRTLKEHGLDLAGDTSYIRGQTFDVSTTPAAKALQEKGVDAIVAMGSYQACAAFVRDVRALAWEVPIYNVSFVGPDAMLSLLRSEEAKSGNKLTKNLINTQVMPSYDDTSLRGVRAYRAAMAKYKPTLPAGVRDESLRPKALYSFGSLEGYVSGMTFVAVLKKAGPRPSRKSFYEAAEKFGRTDVGLGAPLEFSSTRHQGLDRVWFTVPAAGGWKVINKVDVVLAQRSGQ